jgi:hypothetical protein
MIYNSIVYHNASDALQGLSAWSVSAFFRKARPATAKTAMSEAKRALASDRDREKLGSTSIGPESGMWNDAPANLLRFPF